MPNALKKLRLDILSALGRVSEESAVGRVVRDALSGADIRPQLAETVSDTAPEEPHDDAG